MSSVGLRAAMKFGVNLLPYGVDYSKVREAALEAERLGFGSVWLSDHMQRGSVSVLECWTLLSALAVETSRIRLGTSVLCVAYRHPSLLAKAAATLDRLSRGRLELGVGLGYDRAEFVSYGIPFHPFEERAGMLKEALQVMKMLWTEEEASFEGKHYRLRRAACEPKPVQRPHPPVWVAGRSKSVFKVAAELGDGVGMLPYSGTGGRRVLSTLQELEERFATLEECCAAVHRAPRSIRRLIYGGDGGVIVAEDGDEFESKLRRYASLSGMNVETFRARLNSLSILRGDTRGLVEKVEELSDLGVDYLLLEFPGWSRGVYDEMRAFAERVMPAFG